MRSRLALDEFLARVRHVPRQHSLDAAAVELLGACAANGAEPLLLKGPALARSLYHPGEHRGYGDVDVLASPRDLPTVRRLLRELGYRNVSAARGVDDVAGILHSEEWSRPLPDERQPPVTVDLHWRLAGCEAPAEVLWEALDAYRARIELRGQVVRVLAREALALHVATHAAQHGPNDLKALGDLARATDRWSREVWRSAAALAERVGATDAFAAGLRLTARGAELARELELPATAGLEWEIRHRAIRPRGTFHVEELIGATGTRRYLSVLRRALLPAPDWIRWQYPWVRDSAVRLVLAYGAHLLRAPVWAIRAWRYVRRRRRAGA